VDEVWPEPEAWHGKNLQVHGVVVPDSIGVWTTRWNGASIAAQTARCSAARYYTGIVPNTFQGGIRSGAHGTMDAKGFHATEMTAKCPSKYDAAPAGPGGTESSTLAFGRSVAGMASLGYYLLLAAFVVCAYARDLGRRRAPPVACADRERHRRLLPARGHHGVASAVIVYAFVVGDYSIRYVQRYSDSVQPMFYKLTSYWGGLDGSIMFWVSLLAAFGSAAIYINRERHRELIPYVVAVISVRGDVLPLPDDRPQQPVPDVPHGEPHRGRRAQPAAAELLHGDPPADDVSRLRRADDPVRVRHGGAHHRVSRRLVAARGAALDDDLVAVPVDRPRASA
jgi:hypothetical protein